MKLDENKESINRSFFAMTDSTIHFKIFGPAHCPGTCTSLPESGSVRGRTSMKCR